MNYYMGDFGFLNVDSILNAGSTWINNPANQQQLLNAGMNLIAPKPPKPKPAASSSIAPGSTVLPSSSGPIQQKDNTMLYVGLGVAGVALIAVVAGLVMARKK
jgi:hypothetical protein